MTDGLLTRTKMTAWLEVTPQSKLSSWTELYTAFRRHNLLRGVIMEDTSA